MYFAQLEDNFVPLVIISSIDCIYLIGMALALLRNNERRMRKYDKHYQFWRQQHTMRATAKKTKWRKKTWTQLKAQHKLLRVFCALLLFGREPLARALLPMLTRSIRWCDRPTV